MQGLYWAEMGVVVMLSASLLYYYSDKKAPIYAKLLVFISFLCSLICFIILPIDIYQSAEEMSSRLGVVQQAWLIIYYINFFMCWLVLPFAQEFEDSGEFSFSKKLRDSLIMNGIMIGVLCIGAVLIIVYLVFVSQFTIGQLPSVFATLVNVFGLVLVSIVLGYGLVSFPKQCFLRRDYKKLVNHCHRQAEAIKSQRQNILEEIYSIKRVLENDNNRDKNDCRVVIQEIQQNFKFQNFVPDDQNMEQLRKKSTADLHKIVKKRTMEQGAHQSQLDDLVDQLKSTTQSYLKNNYSYKRIYFTILFAVTTILSIIIFFAELATFAKFLAPANLLALMSRGGEAGLVLNTVLSSYIAYIMVHTIFRVKVYKVFSLHKGHSTASSLLFTAINLSRVCYPLCYNYLQITGLPNSSFLKFFGNVTLRDQFTIIFPILMLFFAFFNLFDIYDKILGYLGLGSYAFDAEQAEQKKQEGRNILIERFKERNIQNNHLEMIQLL